MRDRMETTRPMLWPCSPPGSPHPQIRSSICAVSSSGTFSRTLVTTYAARSSGLTSTSEPLRALPIGERPKATITASVMDRDYGPVGKPLSDSLLAARGQDLISSASRVNSPSAAYHDGAPVAARLAVVTTSAGQTTVAWTMASRRASTALRIGITWWMIVTRSHRRSASWRTCVEKMTDLPRPLASTMNSLIPRDASTSRFDVGSSNMEHGRVVHDGPRDRDLLLLPRRKALRALVRERPDVQPLDHGVDPALELAVQDPTQLGEIRDVLACRQPWIDSDLRSDRPDPAPYFPRRRSRVEPEDLDRARIGGEQGADDAQRGGLARAVRPQEPED